MVKDEDGAELLRFEGLTDYGSDYGEECYVYQYSKIGDIWKDNSSVTGIWSLAAQSGYAYLDIANSHNVWMDNNGRNLLLSAHYNYKKGVMEAKLAADVPDGKQVSFKVGREGGSIMRDTTYAIVATGSGTVKERWAAVELVDMEGNPYVPTYSQDYRDQLYVCLCEEENRSNWQELAWYNYNEDSSDNWMSALPIRTTDKKLSVNVGTGLEEGTEISLQLYKGTVAVGEPYSAKTDKNKEVRATLTLAEPLAEGKYTMKALYNGQQLAKASVTVYEKEKFYVSYQGGYGPDD